MAGDDVKAAAEPEVEQPTLDVSDLDRVIGVPIMPV